MRALLAIAAAFALLATPAVAAPITYAMTFRDDAGTQIWPSTFFTYDTDVAVEIWVAPGAYECDGPEEGCELLATWHPLNLFHLIDGERQHLLGALYAEGSYWFNSKLGREDFQPGVWEAVTTDPSNPETLWLPFPDLMQPRGGGAFDYLDGGGGGIQGTVEYDLVAETPLPAAAWLFLAGAASLAAGRKRR